MVEQRTAPTDTRARGDAHLAHLRQPGRGAGVVRPIELFFDLVYVLAVTQLTPRRDAADAPPANLTLPAPRVALIGLMFASLIMSSSLFGAFDDHGLAFAATLSASSRTHTSAVGGVVEDRLAGF